MAAQLFCEPGRYQPMNRPLQYHQGTTKQKGRSQADLTNLLVGFLLQALSLENENLKQLKSIEKI